MISDWDPAPALVNRRDTLGAKERTTYDGEVITALQDEDLESIAAVLRDRNIEAVAVTFLHSYINGEHERKARDFFERALDGRYVCISSEILPEVREFERTSTTVANAYLGPVLERYLSRLAQRLETLGYDGPVLITHSGGGVMSIDAARRIPARVCQSGPAAGVVAGANIGRVAGRPNVISLDVGGTSADASLSKDGKALIRSEWNMDFNITINFASVDVTTIGAGGGSIAHVDDGGVLRVGPRSAGARPGPACYGQGGTEPTVTDANVVLGRLGGPNPACRKSCPAGVTLLKRRSTKSLPNSAIRGLMPPQGCCASWAPTWQAAFASCQSNADMTRAISPSWHLAVPARFMPSNWRKSCAFRK